MTPAGKMSGMWYGWKIVLSAGNNYCPTDKISNADYFVISGGQKMFHVRLRGSLPRHSQSWQSSHWKCCHHIRSKSPEALVAVGKWYRGLSGSHFQGWELLSLLLIKSTHGFAVISGLVITAKWRIMLFEEGWVKLAAFVCPGAVLNP